MAAQQPTDGSSQASPSTRPMEYKRLLGMANMKGLEYDIKMAALIYLRAKQTYESFRLSVNDASAGYFDDIVLGCKSGGEEQKFLMQVKYRQHVKNPIKLFPENRIFNLNKFYNSVKEMNDQSIAEHFKNTHFVFFTNSDVNLGNLTPVKIIDPNVKSLLCTGGNLDNIYGVDINDDIFVAIREQPQALEFTKKLIICSSQANVDLLDEIIKQEFIKLSNGIIPGYKTLHTFLAKIEAWRENSPYYLTECWEEWDKITFLTDQNALLSQVRFHDDVVVELADKILDPRFPVVHVTCDGAGEQLINLKVLQALSRKGSPRFLLASIADHEESLQAVLELWGSGWCNVLVVNLACNSSPEKLQEILNKHKGTEDTRRLILVSGDRLNMDQYLNKELQSNCYSFTDTFVLHQLDEPSRDAVLECRVNCQGKEIRLRSLGAEHILGGNILNSVLTSEEMQLGVPLSCFDSTYIPRTLYKQITIKKDILAVNVISDIFYVSGVTVDELQRMVAVAKDKTELDEYWHETQSARFRTFSDDADLPQELTSAEEPVHHLQMKNNTLYWRQSYGDTHNLCHYVEAELKEAEDIQKLISMCKTCTPREEDLVNAGLRTVIVTGEPGIGKSALLSCVANRLKMQYPSNWIIEVNLNEFSSYFEEIPASIVTEKDVFIMLASAAGVLESTVAEALLRVAIEHTGNVCVLCDGFDEIVPQYTKIVLGFLKIIQQSKVHTLWVTSRCVSEKILELEMTTKVFTLLPLNEKEVATYFANSWGEERTIKLLEMVEKAIHFDDVNRFTLHIMMMMIQKLYQDLVMSDDYSKISKILNVNDIFEKFIEFKLNIYCTEKCEIKKANAASNYIMKNIRRDFMERHMLCAIVVLNITDELEETQKRDILDKVEDYFKDIREGKEKTGIIDGLVDGVPHFIHHTLAEYFAARWLADNKQQNLKYIHKTIFNTRFKIVYEIFSRILAKGCLLHLAVLNNDLPGLKSELRGGVSGEDAGGRTPLHLAAQSHSMQAADMVRLLLDNGADVEQCDTLLECTPLYYAVKAEAWDMVRLLVRCGARVKNSIAGLQPVRHILTRISKEDANFYMYTEFEVNWNIFFENKAISHLVIRYEDLECLKLLLTCGAKTELQDMNGDTLLHAALRYGNLNTLKLLLEYKADIKAINKDGNTVLHIAIINQNSDIVQLLLKHGASITAVNKDGNTPLHEAVRAGNSELVRVLLQHGADPMAINKDGDTPLHEAARVENMELVRVLLQHGADPMAINKDGDTPLHEAAGVENMELVILLLDHGADPMAINKHGNTDLHEAARAGNMELVKLLLEHGADVMAINKHGNTALHEAARVENMELVRVLLDHGADPMAINKHGNTALHEATRAGNMELVRVLLDHGADPMAINKHGNTALHEAARAGNMELVRVLLDHGADVMAINKDGNTPLHEAARAGNMELIILLLK